MTPTTAIAIALLAVALPCAAAKDPFPNQPGALTEAEIAAATVRMKMTPGSEDLPLVASGKREAGHMMPMYAVFASPLVDFSERVKTRRQIWCNYWTNRSDWQCTPAHDEFRATTRGIEHVYSYQVAQGQGDRQAAAEIADYMYSQCFNSHFAAIGGKPFTPSPDNDYVSVVVDVMLDGSNGYNVMTGYQGPGGGPVNMFRLERTDRKKDGCGFRMPHARIGATLIPESYAKVEAENLKKAEEQFRKREAERIARLPPEARPQPQQRPAPSVPAASNILDALMDAAVAVSVLCGLLALVAPFFVLPRGRKRATLISVAMASACVVFGLAYLVLLKVAAITDTGFGLLLVIPAAILGALACLGWVIALAMQKTQE